MFVCCLSVVCLFVYLSAEWISQYVLVKFEATSFCSRFLTDTETIQRCSSFSSSFSPFFKRPFYLLPQLSPSLPPCIGSTLAHTAKGNFNSGLLTGINSKIILPCQLINKTTHGHGRLHLHQWLFYFCAAEKTLQARRQPNFPLLLRLNATHSWIYLRLPLL